MRTVTAVLSSLALASAMTGTGWAGEELPVFRLNDRVTGSINYTGDVDSATFEGLKGTKVKLVLTALVGTPVRLVLTDPDGIVLSDESWVAEVGGKKSKLKEKLKLDKSGTYQIDLESADGTTGVWELKTKGSLPKKAKSQAITKVKPDGGVTGSAAIEFSALDGATTTIDLNPKKFGGQDVVAALVGPLGGELFSGSSNGDGPLIEDFPMPLTGTYTLTLSGFPTNKASANVEIDLVQPKGDKETIVQID